MDLGARWDKVFRDIWDNKARSLLVISTLAIGIAAVGLIHNFVLMIQRDLYGDYANINPASITIYVSPFQKELANSAAGIREVEAAEAARTVSGSVFEKKGDRHELHLVVVPDFNDIQINRFTVEAGANSPGLRTILLERNSAKALDLSIGDPLEVEMESGEKYQLIVSGIIHDMSRPHFQFSGEARGYVSMATLEWMGQEPYYNEINLLVAEKKADREHVLYVAGLVRDRIIESASFQVLGMSIFSTNGNPRDYWAKPQIDGVMLILQIMSVLAIILSGGLVVNTISAVIIQQTRQIGIMRSIGATRRQVVTMYLGYILILSLIGLIVAIPLGIAGSIALSYIAARFVNFHVGKFYLPWNILMLQVGLGLLMPLGVAIFPILRGTRVSVYDAIYQFGMINGEAKRGWIVHQLAKVRNFHPPIMLSLRNTFRNKSRLAFTLVTLTIAGAMFMAVLSAYDTLQSQIRDLGRYIQFDASISIPGGANRNTAEREASKIPEVRLAEGWSLASGYLVHSNDIESDRIEIVGLPEKAQTIQPRIIAGRWLLPSDTDQIVINEDLLEKAPDIEPGDQLPIKINDITRQLTVVGITSKHMTGDRIYMNETEFSKLTGRYHQVDTVRVLATPGSLQNKSEQSQIGFQLEKRYNDANLSTSSSETRNEIFSSMASAFSILLVVLLVSVIILAVIGSLGLTGTMGLNVLERTREIGVLRAVGASHFSVRQVVVVEGVVVAMLSWVLSALLSFPIGRVLAEGLIRTVLGTNAVFKYSFWDSFFGWVLSF